MKSNIIICKTPKLDNLSACLVGTADDYRSGEFYMDFTKINSLEEIIERLDWMESRGYHLINDRGIVWSSNAMANTIENIMFEMPVNPFSEQYRFLTRSGNLRSQVIKLITGVEGVNFV